MAATALAAWLDVLQRGIGWAHMRPTNPARYDPMQLAGYRFVNFVAGEGKGAHEEAGANLEGLMLNAAQGALINFDAWHGVGLV